MSTGISSAVATNDAVRGRWPVTSTHTVFLAMRPSAEATTVIAFWYERSFPSASLRP